jgi:hypothetical protein
MKILFKDKIVENYRFPLSEAISFSILIWTLWGLAEAFYWQKVLPFLEPTAQRLDHRIFLSSFVIYVCLACLLAVACYVLIRLILMLLKEYEAFRFRGLTLASILASFFVITLQYNLRRYLMHSALSKNVIYAVIAGAALLALLFTIFMYIKGTNVGFRLRRPGAMMLSVFILSVLFSVVTFPLFAHSDAAPAKLDFKTSADRTMAYHYFQKLAGTRK